MMGASVPHARDNISDEFVLTGTLLPQCRTEPLSHRVRTRGIKEGTNRSVGSF